jgi:AcrR family transcriptional regulator
MESASQMYGTVRHSRKAHVMTDQPPALGSAPPPRSGQLILEVACEQFYRQGIRAVGVDEVVTRAGFTKPSLYRAYGSKEGLISAYLKVRETALWRSLDEAKALHPFDARARLKAWLAAVAADAALPRARGCAFTNAAVEFPEAEHPARLAAETVKAELRRRLCELAEEAGAAEPDRAGDGILLLIEGAMVSGQLFGADGPARTLVQAADALLGGKAPAPSEALPQQAPKGQKPACPRPAKPKKDEFQPSLF